MVKFFKQYIFEWRLERQIDIANRLRKKTGYKYIVIMWMGRPKAMPQFQIKEMLKMRKFKKGISLDNIRKTALYITF